MNSQRIPPAAAPFDPSIQAAFDAILPTGIPPLNLFRTMAHNPRVLLRMFAANLLDRGSLGVRQRELLILRSTALCGAEYEWGVHVAIYGGKAGFTAPQFADSRHALPDQALWTADELALIALADELHRTAGVSDSLWQILKQHFRDDQIIECIMLCGLYHAVSYMANGLRIAPEDYAARFPVAAA